MNEYQEFLRRKAQLDDPSGFDPVWMPDFLFDFQRHLVDWSIRQGRAAIFADCGLGKTPMQLVWAENVVRKTNGRVLILTPLAVARQTKREAEKFGIDATVCLDGKPSNGINISNYEKLHMFDPLDFEAIVGDESSCLKAFNGKRRKQFTQFAKKFRYRLLCTATAAPNDYIELGTASEALGYMGQMDMLSTFFHTSDKMNHILHKAGDFWTNRAWHFRPHARQDFWRWVSSWARAMQRPSDYGFDDGKFKIPELVVDQHVIGFEYIPEGELLPRVATTLAEQREERRLSIQQRCEKVAELSDCRSPFIAWCQHKEESALLSKIIPDAVEVKGEMPDEQKEENITAFSEEQARVMVTKPQIAGFGLNWQHCSDMSFFPSHSFEQYYQAIRRCLRFGQERPVKVNIVTTPGEAGVTGNLNRKAEQASALFKELVAEMNDSIKIDRSRNYTEKVDVPSWL